MRSLTPTLELVWTVEDDLLVKRIDRGEGGQFLSVRQANHDLPDLPTELWLRLGTPRDAERARTLARAIWTAVDASTVITIQEVVAPATEPPAPKLKKKHRKKKKQS